MGRPGRRHRQMQAKPSFLPRTGEQNLNPPSSELAFLLGEHCLLLLFAGCLFPQSIRDGADQAQIHEYKSKSIDTLSGLNSSRLRDLLIFQVFASIS